MNQMLPQTITRNVLIYLFLSSLVIIQACSMEPPTFCESIPRYQGECAIPVGGACVPGIESRCTFLAYCDPMTRTCQEAECVTSAWCPAPLRCREGLCVQPASCHVPAKVDTGKASSEVGGGQ